MSSASPIKPWKDPTRAGLMSAAVALTWWLLFLSTIALGLWSGGPLEPPPPELLVTSLFLLPWVATIAGIVAIRRSRPHPTIPTDDRRSARGRWMGWTGMLAGGAAPFFLFAYAAERGM